MGLKERAGPGSSALCQWMRARGRSVSPRRRLFRTRGMARELCVLSDGERRTEDVRQHYLPPVCEVLGKVGIFVPIS